MTVGNKRKMSSRASVVKRILLLLSISVIDYLLNDRFKELPGDEVVAIAHSKRNISTAVFENASSTNIKETTGLLQSIAQISSPFHQLTGNKTNKIPVDWNVANASQMFNYHLDAVIHLSGELGNHLSKIVAGYAIKYAGLEMEKPVNVRIHWLNQGIPKSKKTAKELKTCFPNFKDKNLYECNVPSFAKVGNQQELLFDKKTSFLKTNSKRFPFSLKGLMQRLHYITNVMDDGKTIPFHHMQHLFQDDDTLSLSIPFIEVNRFVGADIIDYYYDQIIDLFRFNEGTCCKAVPDPDETVLVRPIFLKCLSPVFHCY